jgi:hypothetical protein
LAPVSAESPETYPEWFAIPQERSASDGGEGWFELNCRTLQTFTMNAIPFEAITLPDISMTPISPSVPGIYTFSLDALSLTVPSWEPISLPVPSLPTTYTFDPSTRTVTVTLPFSIVFNFTTITNAFQPVITRSYNLWEDVEDDVLGGGFGAQGAGEGAGLEMIIQSSPAADLESMELAGYTASDMASELVYGMDLSFSYLRAVADVGILGPTAVSVIIGLGWIAFVTFGQFLFKAILVLIDVGAMLLRLILELIKTILEVIHLIPGL